MSHSRRRFLGSAAAGLPLSLAGLWRAQAQARDLGLPVGPAKIRACIVVFYYGGPSHLDTYDLKPNAPADVRGEFRPIATSAPGVMISEHLPRMARVMHKVAVIRSMHHNNRLHDSASTETLTGRQSPVGDREEFAPIKQFYPCHGATLSKLRSDPALSVPHAALPFVFKNVIEVPCQGGGFLGNAYDPLQINVDPESKTYKAGVLESPAEVSLVRRDTRRQLLDVLARLDEARANQETANLKGYYERAYELLGSQALLDALRMEDERPETRARYGEFATAEPVVAGGGSHMGFARNMRGQNLLLARRLVEAGIPFVNVYDFRQQGQNWDAHAQNFQQHKNFLLPQADQALAALIEDLDERGLLDSTLVVALGEFGRTPKINENAGRDHWPDCYSLVLAGGGVKGGYVHGSSDRLGAYPDTNPVSPADLAATIYSRFGFGPETEIHDTLGRPYRIADGLPVNELFEA